MSLPESLPTGEIIAEEYFLGVTAYAVKHNRIETVIELNILTQDANFHYTEGDIVIHVPMGSDIFTLPLSEVSKALDINNYKEVNGSDQDNNVAYCYKCVTPERRDILEITTNHNFYIHEHCLNRIRQSVEKLIAKNSEELVINSFD